MNAPEHRPRSAWQRLGLYLAVAALAVIVGFWARRAWSPGVATGDPSSQVAFAEPARRLEFSLEALGGGEVEATDFAGRVVVVDFWATWCGPCKIQGEILHALEESYREEPVSFLAVNVGESADLIHDYVADDPFAYPVLMDPEQTLSAKYGIYALPTVMVLDRQQGILFKNMGVASGMQVRAAIDRALASG